MKTNKVLTAYGREFRVEKRIGGHYALLYRNCPLLEDSAFEDFYDYELAVDAFESFLKDSENKEKIMEFFDQIR